MIQQPIPHGETDIGPDRDGRESVPQAAGSARLLQLLDERLRFESLLARLSATFIILPAEEVDGQIELGLRQIVEFLGIERSGVAQFSEDGGRLVNTHIYTVPGFPTLPPVNLAAVLPWYAARIREGRVLRFSRLPDDLPPEAVAERQYCVQAGIRSQLTIPFKVGDSVLGGIGFASFRRQRDWPDDLVQSLQLVAEIFANAQAHKVAEGELRQSEARLRFLLESTQAIPWVADATTWRFTYVGPQARELLGHPVEAWYEKDFWVRHLHPEDREGAVAFCLEHSRGHTDYVFDYRMVAADGRAVWLHDVVNVVAEDGAPKMLHGFLIDVTARRQAEEVSRGLREQLARVGRVNLLGELVASIAHEVNQPLCAIGSNAGALQRMLDAQSPSPEEVRETLQDIVQDSRRAAAVLARIRGLLRKAPAVRTPVGLNDLIGEVVALTRAEMARRGVAVRLELAAGLPPVHADRVQLQQVMLNLLANGADATERVARGARELVVRSSAGPAGAVTVAVRDNGVGLGPADAGQVFDPFFTTKPGSIGMGLTICKSILDAHDGTISAAANDGPGSTFQFTLPGVREGTP